MAARFPVSTATPTDPPERSGATTRDGAPAGGAASDGPDLPASQAAPDAGETLERMTGSPVRTLESRDIDLGEWARSGTFRVSSPAKAPPEDGANESISEAVDTTEERRPLVFIVDRDEASRELLAECLAARGYELVLLASGAEARQQAARRPPDLVLLDPLMEGDEGFLLVRALRESAPHGFVPLLLVTAPADDDSLLRAIEAGADQIVPKPVNRHQLRARVKNLLQVRAQQEELAVRYSQLKSRQRLKDETTAMLIHDLKSPLTVLTVNLEYAMGDLLPHMELAEVHGALVESRAGGLKLKRMIANLLNIARSDDVRLVPKKRKVDIDTLFRDALAEHAHEAHALRLVVIRNVTLPGPIDADADILGRALTSIVENVIRYACPGGRLVLSAREHDEGIEISIENDGRLPAPESVPQAFEKYAQFGAAESGVVPGLNRGLGLYFARIAVEAHGGRITLATAPEQSSVSPPVSSMWFKIVLPRT